ncbi:MAG: TIM barrel protein [Acidimicrobiia bacterium]
MDDSIRFAVNRICAARMPFPAFVAMVRRLGVDTIELRNDLDGVETRDGTSPDSVAAMAQSHGLKIRSINSLQRFDLWDTDRQREATELMRYASACGAEAIVLCPTNSRQDLRTGEQRHDDLLRSLSQLLPLLDQHGLVGLVEPLGFPECAVRSKSQVVGTLQAIGAPASLQLVHDTFHHHLTGEGLLFPEYTGLVHVSGVDDPTIVPEAMRDPHRVLVGPDDRLGNAAQLRTLLDAGYRGAVSFEPFDEAIIGADDIEQQLARSMAYLSAAVADSTGLDVNSVR